MSKSAERPNGMQKFPSHVPNWPNETRLTYTERTLQTADIHADWPAFSN